ncbi:MAG: Zn-ribbon domain-containing OB-fold protein [Trebonia sp.]|jgi:uncharacterized OB-fold protein
MTELAEQGARGPIEIVDIPDWPGPWPIPDPVDTHYWQAAAVGELLIQECPACGRRQHFPRSLCVRCGATPGWRPAAGRGVIYSYTVVRQMGVPPFSERVPYVVALIDLEEGPRLMGNVVDCAPELVRIGRPVTAVIHRFSPEIAAPQWRLA